MRPQILLLLFTGAYAAGCQPAPRSLTETHRQALADTLMHVANELFRTWNAGEEDAYLNGHLVDSTFTFAFNGVLIRGWPAFADTVRAHRRALRESHVSLDQAYTDVLGPDVGVVTTTFEWVATDTSGTRVQLHGTYTMLMSLTAAGWKVRNVAESFPIGAP